MNKQERTILVVGATGSQGGAVTCCLLSHNWHVRALTHDPNRPGSQKLVASGVEVVKGDLNNIASLDEALKGVYGVFSVQTFEEQGPSDEVLQGMALADAAKNAHIEHFIYSSIGGADRNSAIPHFESKWEIEQYIRTLGLPATVLRPVFFMDNFKTTFGATIEQGVLSLPLHPTTKLQMIAADDIGGLVALAFQRPQHFLGKALEIAGDELTMSQVAEVFSRVQNHPVHFVEQPIKQASALDQETTLMMEWLNSHGYRADIPALRALYPELQTLEAWLRKNSSH